MHLLVLVNVFAPDRGGAAAVYSDMCYQLVRRSVDVTVCAPYPFYPEWKDKSGRNGLRVWKYHEHGINVRRYGLHIPRKPASFLPRLACEISIFLSMLRTIPLARKADAVMVYCPHACFLVLGWLIKHIFGKPVWLNVQDIAGDAAVATMSVSPFFSAIRAIEAALIRSYHVCSTISPSMRDKLQALRTGRPVHMIPNWADHDIIAALEATPVPDSVLQRRAAPSRPTVHLLYAGNVSAKQNLLELCQYLARCDANFHFKIFAAGGRAADIERWVSTSADSRFAFGPFLGPMDYARELRNADFYVISETSHVGPAFFPSKAVVGMSAGIPILGICDPDSPLGIELSEHPVGVRYSWNQLDELGKLLSELNAGIGVDRLNRWHAESLARSLTFDRDAILSSIYEILRGMVVSNQVAPTSEPRCARNSVGS